jgi:hypothetical protein
VRRSDALRSFVVATWLGWQIESNWADPFLFAVYSIVRPLASVLILVVMYAVITASAFEDPMFAYIFLGNALYILVGMVITGVSWAIIDDREHYRVAKHLYTAPINGYTYLFSGAIFPLDVLPVWLRWIGFLLSVTYWLEAARRALLGPAAAGFTTLAFLSNQALVAILAGFTVVLLVGSAYFYRWVLHMSKEKGLVDMESGY